MNATQLFFHPIASVFLRKLQYWQLRAIKRCFIFAVTIIIPLIPNPTNNCNIRGFDMKMLAKWMINVFFTVHLIAVADETAAQSNTAIRAPDNATIKNLERNGEGFSIYPFLRPRVSGTSDARSDVSSTNGNNQTEYLSNMPEFASRAYLITKTLTRCDGLSFYTASNIRSSGTSFDSRQYCYFF
jgi:hypothetical protein